MLRDFFERLGRFERQWAVGRVAAFFIRRGRRLPGGRLGHLGGGDDGIALEDQVSPANAAGSLQSLGPHHIDQVEIVDRGGGGEFVRRRSPGGNGFEKLISSPQRGGGVHRRVTRLLGGGGDRSRGNTGDEGHGKPLGRGRRSTRSRTGEIDGALVSAVHWVR